MSKHYTDEDLRVVAQAIADHFNPPDDLHSTWWINPGVSARAVLDAVAPAIAARALREFADNNVAAQTAGRMAEDLHARADEIEAGR